MPFNTNGSIGIALHGFIEDIPSAISGTNLLDLIDSQRQFVADFTNTSIGSNAIQAKYGQVIFMFSAAELLNMMNLFGVDATNFRLGDFSVDMGGETNLEKSSDKLREEAWMKLRHLGKAITIAKANG